MGDLKDIKGFKDFANSDEFSKWLAGLSHKTIDENATKIHNYLNSKKWDQSMLLDKRDVIKMFQPLEDKTFEEFFEIIKSYKTIKTIEPSKLDLIEYIKTREDWPGDARKRFEECFNEG
ncbi:MAG: hypothetical protein Nk1A_7190 [Endomicrobiia bacterium]|nr:MAG: hypothetical protein Nk1A_7190 [Endomicrobiia bacterium]